MFSEFRYILDIFFYKKRELRIDSFRKSLSYIYNICLIPAFFIYSLVFYLYGNLDFAIAKLIFGMLFLCLLLIDIKNSSFYPIYMIILFASYCIFVYLDETEVGYGFVWSFFVIPMAILLLGYKKGILILIPYIILICSVGIYDINNYGIQFTDYLSFFMVLSVFLLLIIVFSLLDYVILMLNDNLVNISETDYLTRLYNRRKIDQTLKEKITNQEHLSVAILDIDDFKKINDEDGHQAGDEVLRTFANILRQNIRSTDMVGRWGGEEFIIIFSNTNIDEANICVKKIKKAIKNTNFINNRHITCSFGLSNSTINLSLDELILRADSALYRAKESGKDKIVLA